MDIQEKVISDFGKEWTVFDQSAVPEHELRKSFQRYFSIFPFDKLPENSVGFDLGCGSGRWALFVAPQVGTLHCLDPSILAINVAKKKLAHFRNCIFHSAGVDNIPLQNNSMDFGYSLGVLHHITDTNQAIQKCVEKLKPGAPFLLYLYYSFDNKPVWFRYIWSLSNILRRAISVMPFPVKYSVSQIIALLVYLPLAKSAYFLEQIGVDTSNIPLSAYRDKSFYTMRTDALDRFGTRLEKRFSRQQIHAMMQQAGLGNIIFGSREPYWCAVGYKTSEP